MLVLRHLQHLGLLTNLRIQEAALSAFCMPQYMTNEVTKEKLDVLWDEGGIIEESNDKLNEYLILVSNFYSESEGVNAVDTIRVSIISSIIQQRYFINIKRQNTIYAWVIFLLVAISTLVNLQAVLQNMSWIWNSLS